MMRARAILGFCLALVGSEVLGDGLPDPSFGGDGFVLTHFGPLIQNSQHSFRHVVVQPDGRIVAGGDISDGLNDHRVGLARFMPDGELDVSFGGTGLVVVSDIVHISGLVVQPDGKVVISSPESSPARLLVVRYLADGSLDPSFGAGGKAYAPGTPVSQEVQLALQPDGKVIVGASTFETGPSYTVARFLMGGTLDPSFGVNGVTSVDPSGNHAGAMTDLTLQPDGKVVCVGTAQPTGSDQIAVLRLTVDGQPDPTFGTSGVVLTDVQPGNAEYPNVILPQPAGKLLVLGAASPSQGDWDMLLMRYDPGGTLDPSFGAGGIVIQEFFDTQQQSFENAMGGVRQPNGNIVIAFGPLARFTNEGAVDTTFGDNGVLLIKAGLLFQGVVDVVLTSAGRLLGAGYGSCCGQAGVTTLLAQYTLLPDDVDVSVTITDGQTEVLPGQSLTYTIVVANSGPGEVAGVEVTDDVPAVLQGAAWTCAASAGSSCTATGSGSIQDTVNVKVGGQVIYTLTGVVDPAATGSLVNTVVVNVPPGKLDLNPTNNVATDVDTIGTPPGPPIEGEVSHGSSRRYDLAASGTVADVDLFAIFQRPHASYEVLVDAISADISSGSGPLLELVASDFTPIHNSTSATGGASRSLRWINASDAPVTDQLVRVRSAGCGTTCDAADVYRLSARETTAFVPRFNNSQTQTTVLVLQNQGEQAIQAEIRLLDPAGTALGTSIASLAAHSSYVFDTSLLAPGLQGSIRIANTGRYGQIAGKAVSIEPATGFTFDTPLRVRLP